MQTREIEELARGSAHYPKPLEKLSDPPDRIYVKGRMPVLPAISIVGTRNADTLSCRFAANLAGALVDQGFCVVSGGALGIDTAAHRGALSAGGTTVAVIGSGFDFLYPPDNKNLFEDIADSGALMTEFPAAQPPTKWTFPKRNRLVAALSFGVVVVQAGAHSGALITARLAEGLGIPVGVVPGIAGDPKNRGNHDLLRRGAILVEDVRDVLALISMSGVKKQLDLPGVERPKSGITVEFNESYSPAEVKILDILCARPIHIDEITATIGLMPGETSAAMLALELRGLVEDKGGRNYVRLG